MMKKKLKKGFTLIELLAVIVILAIIALIAVPIILNIVDEASKGAFKGSAYGIVEAGELGYAKDLLDGNVNEVTYTYSDGIETSSIEGKKLDYKGDKPKNGTIVVNNRGQVALAIHDGKYCAEKGFEESNITVDEKAIEDCELSSSVEEKLIFGYGGSAQDFFEFMAIANDGYIGIGKTGSADGDLTGVEVSDNDYIVVKFDLSGNVVWQKRVYPEDDIDLKNVIAVNDGYIVVGYKEVDIDGKNTKEVGIIIKYDKNGNIAWEKETSDTLYIRYYDIVAVDGGYIIVGQKEREGGDYSTNFNGFIGKYDLSGDEVWTKTYTDADGSISFENISIAPDGSIIVAGDAEVDEAQSGDGIILKYDASGNLVWNETFGGSEWDYFNDVIATSTGYVVVGYSESTDGDFDDLNKGGRDAYIIKYSTSGEILWNKNYGGSGKDEFYGVGVIGETIYVAGYTESSDGDVASIIQGGHDIIGVKFDASGNIVSSRSYSSPTGSLCTGAASSSSKFVILGIFMLNDGDFNDLQVHGGGDLVVIVEK